MSSQKPLKDERPMCQYGSKCYRKNPLHFEEYRHPDKGDDDDGSDDNSPPRKRQRSSSPNRIESSYENKLSFYFTKVRGIPAKHNDDRVAMGIKDILSHKMGDLQASVQFNYMVEIPWLMQQYPQDKRSKPLLIVHGSQGQSRTEMMKEAEQFPNISFFQARLEAYGTHHSKMMLLLYTDGLRVVITTANLILRDWDQKTQGVWISPKFQKISSREGAASSSSISAGTSHITARTNTNFKKDLLEYLCAYGGTALDEWKKHIRQHDLSSARVRLIASVPGRHSGASKSKWGHLKLRKVLQEHGPSSADVAPSWPVVGQFSSIGSLGNDKSKWLCAEWLQSMAATSGRMPGSSSPLNLVFPSVDDVRLSLEGYPAGGSIPYSHKTAAKQPYLTCFFCRWKSNSHGRSQASPHIKSYIRVSPDTNKLAWFMVTSSNLSKAAWGAMEKNGSQLMIRSYEIGVLFLPKDQDPSQDFFSIEGHTHAQTNSISVPVPFDLPVTRYSKDDKPWMWDVRYTDKPDSHGNIWSPS